MDGISKLENQFARFYDNKHAVAVNSGTSALILAVKALGIKKGDEVIVPDFTMISTAWAVNYNNAKPVFVDCDDSLNINIDLIEKAITKKTKAIMITHIYGRVVDMEKVIAIADKYNLKVIEDACEAHGAKGICKADITCFSFYQNKIVAGEEGGMCLTNNNELAEKMRWLKCMCFNGGMFKYLHNDFGFNFRMPESQTKLILQSLKNVKQNLKKRKEIEKIYNDNLNKDLLMPNRAVVWVYDIKTEKARELLKYLQDKGIQARPFFYPMSRQPIYKQKEKCLNSFKRFNKGLYLPVDITKKQAINISNLINKYLYEKPI